MDLTNKQTIQELLQENELLAKKSYGQHFLIDQQVMIDILKAADLVKPDRNRRILEIGPGLGVLTQKLLQVVGKVVAVEADRELVEILKNLLKDPTNLTLVPAPIQKFHRDQSLKELDYDLVANLPYNISSYVLRSFLEQSPRPKQLVVMVQKEVAERVVAKAGESERSILSLSIELLADSAEIVRIISPQAFWPAPKVESAILKIKTKKTIDPDCQKILRIAKFGFAQRRKKISNSLASGLRVNLPTIYAILKSSGVDANLRPQDLTLNQWTIISQKI